MRVYKKIYPKYDQWMIDKYFLLYNQFLLTNNFRVFSNINSILLYTEVLQFMERRMKMSDITRNIWKLLILKIHMGLPIKGV